MIIEATAIVIAIAGAGLWYRRTRRPLPANQNQARAANPEAPPLVASASGSVPKTTTVSDSLQPLEVNDRVGGYTLEAHLGEGGMADVFLARKAADSGDSVALKVLKPNICSDPQFRRRFEREVNLCKDIDHPNIVRLQDWGDENGRLYLAMEHVKGRPLTDCLSPEGLPLGQVAGYIEGLVAGLCYAHERGIIHRDLKPDNVMVTTEGQIKIMDFGLARDKDGEKVTKTGDSMGTPAYVPPEQITGAAPTPAADQYSLGVMLYEMLTGRRPFLEKNPLKMLMQHLSEAPPNPAELKPDLHPTVVAIVLRMLEKNPENRFSSLQMISEGLSAVERGSVWTLPELAQGDAGNENISEIQLKVAEGPADNDDTIGFQSSN